MLLIILKMFSLTVLACFSIFFPLVLETAKSQDIVRSEEVIPPASDGKPLLIQRFESPISPGPTWDKLRTPLTELTQEHRRAFAIRLCSDRALLTAFPSAVSDPLQIIKELKARYRDQRSVPPIYLLRSDDCVAPQLSNMYAIELWGIADPLRLPGYIEKYDHRQVKMISLGFDPSICSTANVNHLKAARKLIRAMRRDQISYGAVIGYHIYGEMPDTRLRDSMAKVKTLLENSGLPATRYTVSNEIWHTDDSDCVSDPITKPSIFFVTKSY